MPSEHRTKEEYEEFLVRDFLDQQGVQCTSLEPLSQRIPAHGERGISGPDVWAKTDWQGKPLEVAFEVTDYYLDLDKYPPSGLAWTNL